MSEPAGTVALLGTGRMGSAVARVLADSGISVRVWNRTFARADALRGPGILPVREVKEAVDGVDAVISTLTDGAAVWATLAGLISTLTPQAVLIEASTIDASTMAELALGAEDRIVSCAISGTPAVVLNGQAGVLISGTDEAKAKAVPVLEAFAARTVDVGIRVEDAKLIKIGINAVLAGTMELLAESTVLLEAAGVDREAFRAALAGSVLSSTFTGYKLDALVRRDYAATFATRDLRKDVGLALTQGALSGVTLPFAEQLAHLLDDAVARGWGDHDFLSLVPRLQAASGRPSDLPDEVTA